MRFYMTTPKDSAKDYTMEEMYQLNEWQNKIIHPLDDEAKYWKQWINDPLTIKKYYDEDAPKYFGRKPDKNRKIYNGMMKTYFYSYQGAKPPRQKF